MNTSRNIFLVCIMLLLIPVLAKAQVGTKKIILSSGDTTVLVNNLSSGLKGDNARFLNPDKRFKEEQVFLDMDTRYTSLEEAALDVNKLLDKVAKEQSANRTVNASLAFRASQVERMKRKKEVVAISLADSIMAEESALKLAEAYAKFGNKPTYYINGIEVDPIFVEYLRPEDVLSRAVIATNTLSGNPNGEIWVRVLPEVAEFLMIGDDSVVPFEEPVLFDERSQFKEPIFFEDNIIIEDFIKVSPPSKNKPKELNTPVQKIDQDGQIIKSEINFEDVEPQAGTKDEPTKSVRRIKENQRLKDTE